MVQRSFLGDMLTTLFERRRVSAHVADKRSISDMCTALLAAEGEVSGLTLGQSILDRYAGLKGDDRRAFFRFLNDELEIDCAALARAVDRYTETGDPSDYIHIATRAEPRRQELLRRLNQAPGATLALVRMRQDLLGAVREDPDLARTDQDFRHLLRSWFNRGFLVLRQISWKTPANILDKIVAYEAVHAIDDLDDLRRRLYPQDRRCFAYFHPAMPEEPLIFVEVALTMSVPGSIQHLLADDRDPNIAEDTKVAVFYSISNCQAGLKGVSFGNLLIKQVVAELQRDLPGLETFVTLSPIPRLADWLAREDNDHDADLILSGDADADTVRDAAADYLLHAKSETGAPLDPVARFHLGNGAQIYAVHGDADLSDKGRQQSGGAMVNYQYDLALIEQNHEGFVRDGAISMTAAFRTAHAKAAKPKKQKPVKTP